MDQLAQLAGFEGEFYTDELTRRLYATDASAYRELPTAVAVPKTVKDIQALVELAKKLQIGLIPRTAGTSLAGQVVGSGIVVDVSKFFNEIIEVNTEQEWVTVQPGVVRDDLNRHLKPYGYFFAPETSTANRAMIGGMIGNNSCGSNSMRYGSTREHLLEVRTVLSDGTIAWFGPMDNNSFIARCNGHHTSGDLHTHLYLQAKEMLMDSVNQTEIVAGYPNPKIPRRNTGYALDMLLRQMPFQSEADPFNFCSLLAGSEGTLAFVTEAKLKLTKLPSPHKQLVCIHNDSIDQALQANLIALNYEPTAAELMDHYILEATERNTLYKQYRFFVEGSPKAILVVELTKGSQSEVEKATSDLISDLKSLGLGYSFPIVTGDNIAKVWGLRKAGLGLLSNVPGDAKPAPVIEDTAVEVAQLPAYIRDFNLILDKHGLYSVHYAHAGSGELHLRPILDLKTKEGIRLFRVIAEEIADLVKQYNGSLSGEHGDGRLRGEFIPKMLGQHNYELCKQLKANWDPHDILNPGKITSTPPMDTKLRYDEGQKTPDFETIFDFSDTQGLVRAAELCNGSGDCRKTELSGGTMCPSYMATRNEKDTTRARANILREVLTKKGEEDPMANKQIGEVMDLCISCKGCKSECPSNVDMAKLKAEYQYQHYQRKGVPFRTLLISKFTQMMAIASKVPLLYRWTFNTPLIGAVAKSIVGFAPKRSMPLVRKETVLRWLDRQDFPARPKYVYFFVDEFTNYNDSAAGIKAIKLLNALGYQTKFVKHQESGRTFLSKGLLDRAKEIAEQNVTLFAKLVSQDAPLVGFEPSAILTFRDEYISLLRGDQQIAAKQLSEHTFTIEEFISREIDAGHITSEQFHKKVELIKVHGHCHQKALSSMTPSKKMLSVLPGRKVQMIPSGCCGMAGSFGYEKEHYDVSMRIGELVLFPTVRSQPQEVVIAAAGTSCRHQIKDGTARAALHPAEIMYDALIH
ncbi:MAG: FAD/FMN-containing dehydrogenase/Fe-S oxidoreductase [Cyclobacteriaceae bacterium]|jgi:FAD/FMN-containing dehydrogenase/Fe-S oxidoreductase